MSRPFEGGEVISRQELENSVHHCYMAPDEATTSGLLCCSIFFTKLAITTMLFSRIPYTVRVSSSLDPDQARHDKLYKVDINKDPRMTLTYMIIIVI